MSELLFVTNTLLHFFLDQRESPVCIRNPDYERLLRGGSGIGFHSARVSQHWTKERRKGYTGHHPQFGGVSKSAYWPHPLERRPAVVTWGGADCCEGEGGMGNLGSTGACLGAAAQTGLRPSTPGVTTWSPFFQAFCLHLRHCQIFHSASCIAVNSLPSSLNAI